MIKCALLLYISSGNKKCTFLVKH